MAPSKTQPGVEAGPRVGPSPYSPTPEYARPDPGTTDTMPSVQDTYAAQMAQLDEDRAGG